MHEASIASNIIKIAWKVALENNAKKISRITIIIGELQLIDLEALKFAFEAISETIPIMREARLEIESKPAKFKCLECSEEWSFSSKENMNKEDLGRIHFTPDLIVNYLKCPKCGLSNFEIINGKELYIKEIEIATS